MDEQIFDQVGIVQPLVHNSSEQGKRDMGLFLHGVDSLPPLQASGLGSAHVGKGLTCDSI